MVDGDKLLILDLDETLFFATREPLARAADLRVGSFFVYKRPHLDDFLASCRRLFTLAVWTSGSPRYARNMVDALFSHPQELAFLWDSERCTLTYDLETGERHWVKDLKKVREKDYSLESVICVDDSPEKYARSYGNLVQIAPFLGDEADRELPHLLAYLERLRTMDNIRAVEKRRWRGEKIND